MANPEQFSGATLIPEEQYRLILRSMPIPCVDLLVVDQTQRVLLLMRTNEPVRGMWWLPGGRVHFGETREHAALRKLREECRLEAVAVRELTTQDLLLQVADEQRISHAITTVYRMEVDDPQRLLLDSQSADAAWHSAQAWLRMDLHPFVRQCLALA